MTEKGLTNHLRRLATILDGDTPPGVDPRLILAFTVITLRMIAEDIESGGLHRDGDPVSDAASMRFDDPVRRLLTDLARRLSDDPRRQASDVSAN